MKLYIKNKRKFFISFVFLLLIIHFLFNIIFMLNSAKCEEVILKKQYISIKISKNDTLWNIAKTYKKANQNILDYLKEIKHVNNINSDIIKSGEFLIVPIDKETFSKK